MSERAMRDEDGNLVRHIPPADPDCGFSIRITRAIDELASAVNAHRLTPEQYDRIKEILS